MCIRDRILHVEGHLATEVGDYFFRCADHGFRFVAEEAGGADIRLKSFGRDRSESFDGGILAKELRRDAVHVYVGRLSRKNCCDQEFPCAGVGKGAGDVLSLIHI